MSNSDIFFFSSSKSSKEFLGQGIGCTVTKTNIALLQLCSFVLLSEVTEQHPAPAHILRSDILFHRFDAGFIPGFAFFVDGKEEYAQNEVPPFAVYII